jgi:hypothetical protein
MIIKWQFIKGRMSLVLLPEWDEEDDRITNLGIDIADRDGMVGRPFGGNGSGVAFRLFRRGEARE